MIAPISFRTFEVSDAKIEHEGLRFVTIKSPALNRRADCTFWVPEVDQIDILLILLHGVYGSAWSWPMKAGAHRTAGRMTLSGEVRPMVVAMPSDGLASDGSGYLSYPCGEDVERWIVDEVPAAALLAAPRLLPNAKIGIAGLSMGGYGALRLGAKYASRFSAISGHSSITDIKQMTYFAEEALDFYLRTAPREELCVLHWIRLNRNHLPPLRFDCGAKDPLVVANRELHSELTTDQIEHVYEEFDGDHTWEYWTEHFQQTLRFISAASTRANTSSK